jgi:methyl-accepting chemotaxis protein
LLLGKLDVESDYTTDDEIGRLFRAFQNLTDSMKQQAEVLDKLAAGDYTVSIDMRSEEDRVNKSIQTLCDKTREALMQVHMVAGQVSLGSEQIAQASTSLATGSTEQAATIEDFSGRIDRVKQAAENNAQQAAETYNSSREASELMQRSVNDMTAMLDAMDSISDMSSEISKVIKVIDDIAFQTNILALNASVEAARAGQHGKGFAVVAEEVRNLAAKSAEAAKETAVLLERSVANVDAGNIIVKRVSEGLKAVDELTMKNAGAVEAINADSHRQSEMMEEINEGIAQISSVVQLNSATAEETAAAAQEMNAQSTILKESVNRFRLS